MKEVLAGDERSSRRMKFEAVADCAFATIALPLVMNPSVWCGDNGVGSWQRLDTRGGRAFACVTKRNRGRRPHLGYEARRNFFLPL
jgi:hypothetical protein